MATKIKLKLKKRKLTGRKVKQLRRQGILPANIYGKNIKSMSVEVDLKDFQSAYQQAGETNIINIRVDKETKDRPVLISNIHIHPVTDQQLHVDFHQVDLTKKVTVDIPVELKGEAPAVSKGGVLVQTLNQIQVEALPTDLPDKFEIDISNLEEIGQGIALKQIKIDSKVKLLTENLDEVVVKVEEPTKEEEKPEAEPEEEKPEDGETKEDKDKDENAVDNKTDEKAKTKAKPSLEESIKGKDKQK